MIEKNIAMPVSPLGTSTIKKMEVGDSIFEDGALSTSTSDSVLYRNAQQFGYRTGRKFSARKVEGGVRVWRVK